MTRRACVSGPQKTRLSSVGKVQRALGGAARVALAYSACRETQSQIWVALTEWAVRPIPACTAPIGGGGRAEPFSGPLARLFCAGMRWYRRGPCLPLAGRLRALAGHCGAAHLLRLPYRYCSTVCGPWCAAFAGRVAFLVLSYARVARASPVSFVASQRATMRAYKLTLRAALRTGSNR